MKILLNQILLIISFNSICFFSPLYSQSIDPDDPTGAIKLQFETVIKNKFGQNYRCAFSVLDSVIKRNESTYDGGELSDPYNTLKGYILFGADKNYNDDPEDGKGIMGIYKNGQIIWHTDSIFKGGWYVIKSMTGFQTISISTFPSRLISLIA